MIASHSTPNQGTVNPGNTNTPGTANDQHVYVPNEFYGCRLFILNLDCKALIQRFRAVLDNCTGGGYVVNFFTIQEEKIGILDVDSPKTARQVKKVLNGQTMFGQIIQVKILGHKAKIWVGDIPDCVSNEILKAAFETFGEVSRVIVVTDCNGVSRGYGFVEFTETLSARRAVETCNQQSFMLTRSGPPVKVEYWNEIDDIYGLSERFFVRSEMDNVEVSIPPRIVEEGTFEYDFTVRWKQLLNEENELKLELETKLEDRRKQFLNEYRQALDAEEKNSQAPMLNTGPVMNQNINNNTISSLPPPQHPAANQHLNHLFPPPSNRNVMIANSITHNQIHNSIQSHSRLPTPSVHIHNNNNGPPPPLRLPAHPRPHHSQTDNNIHHHLPQQLQRVLPSPHLPHNQQASKRYGRPYNNNSRPQSYNPTIQHVPQQSNRQDFMNSRRQFNPY